MATTPIKDPVVKALLQLVRDSNWNSNAFVVYRRDDFSPPREEDGATSETTYELKGQVVSDRAAASGCWTPDRLMDKCDEISEQFNREIVCSADFVVEAAGVKVKDLLVADKTASLVELGRNNIILCWTSFHEDTEHALSTLAKLYPQYSSQSTRIIGLVLDEQPHEARSKARKAKLPFDCFWVGSNGWTSKAAKALSVEESAPSCYVFDKNGTYVTSGTLEDAISYFSVLQRDDATGGDTFANNQIIPKELWSEIQAKLTEFRSKGGALLTATLRTSTTYHCVEPQVSTEQRVTIAGEVFADARSEYFAFLDSVSKGGDGIRINYDGVQQATKPQPFIFDTKCTQCNGSSIKYGCLVCSSGNVTLCEGCGKKHDVNHPLVVLGLPLHDLGRSLYGIGHVVLGEDQHADDGSTDAHPDIGCDACLSALGPKALRYKNLARTEHELCEKCFGESAKFKGTDKACQDKFSCTRSDPFSEMKTSRGISFSRLDASFVPPQSTPAESLKQNTPLPETSGAPAGHTRFSWISAPELCPPGHTRFSWGA